ncbi:flocculation protein FLO11 [Scaptodrosophila lebanonensis]|uniref:Flocculation protein FLO11 n=1 Tax=Drosophila lebanonensis TaxID=7225 RepID=A0A6J2U057_DROLE|nr:flocculation protein FLO11 [Scaptodrosophila lebanonensis]
MDARKQKRLGPAPIASFEKSFEDNTTTQQQQRQQQQQMMATSEASGKVALRSKTKTTTTISSTTTSTTNTSASEAPSISGRGTAASTTQSSSSSSSSPSSVTCSSTAISTVAKQRPPPLKTATTTVTTTLVSSNEGGQPMPPVAGVSNFRGTATLTTPSTPRIELSRASSSSHHEEDSRDSSPENVFEQVGTGTLQETIGLGFREEGALELRSSTEELYFMDPEQKKEEQERQQQQQQAKRSSPHIFKFDDHQSYLQQHQRKDSASSEVAALLCISGRTSRISSVGSQGSAVSRLSAVSGVSRSPSPHRMLLETSFCGPKPLEHGTDGAASGASNASTAPSSIQSIETTANTALLEQVLLARKHDPTQVVLAEGIQVENLSAAGRKSKPSTLANGEAKTAKHMTAPSMGAQRRSTKSPGQMVIGKTPSGTEYIRINLRPDHMYSDKGIAANERVVEAPNQLTPVYSKSAQSATPKPASLSLQGGGVDEHRLTPTASPKPARHAARLSSRSPSPATTSVSRKSSFSSLFRLGGGGGKDSPDSPRECSRSRSKSKERPTPQSQNVTPSKQKSVLAIFKPGKRGSSAGTDGTKSSKSSSPIDAYEMQPQPPPAPSMPGRSRTPVITSTGSRPNSRLRYYDEPVEGVIHIPLHTPPEEREARTLLQGIQQLAAAASSAPSPPPLPSHATAAAGAPITASQLAAAAAALKPVGPRKGSGTMQTQAAVQARPAHQQRIENLDAIQTLPADEDNKDRAWSLEVQRHSSQDSQETLHSVTSVVSARAANLAQVTEHVARENCVTEIHRLPSVESTQSACEPRLVETVATVNAPVDDPVAKERRRLLFATRLGSGSQEQLFSTQFSISKTESQSSQLSEQVQESGSTASECTNDGLQRQGTVIRRTEIGLEQQHQKSTVSSSEEEQVQPSPSTVVAAVVMRPKHKSHSNSEEEQAPLSDVRHSRYLENFDVSKKYHENVPRKPKRQSITEPEELPKSRPTLPQPPPPSTAPSPSPPLSSRGQSQSPVERRRTPTPTKPPRASTPTRRSSSGTTPTTPTMVASMPQAVITPPNKEQDREHQFERHSTDEHEPIESSESERDSDMAGSSSVATAVQVGASGDSKRHHFPRNVCLIEEHESTGLVSQESFDDDLPYIPTTLPEERAQGVPLIPMKERANMELKTCPVDRPRSTTPLNPSHLEEYCGIMTPHEAPNAGHELGAGTAGPSHESSAPVRGEKLRISLPRKDSAAKDKAQSSKSPRRISNASGKSWFEFAEEGLRAGASNLERKDSNKQLLASAATTTTTTKASTVPAAAEEQTRSRPSSSTQRKLSGHWIDFENIPEKRKPAKRITTLPKETITTTNTATTGASTASTSACASTGHRAPPHAHHQHHHHQQRQPPDVTGAGAGGDKLHYNYVKPEDCQCECHEAERGESLGATAAAADTSTGTGTGSESLASVDLLQQGEDMLPLLEPEAHDSSHLESRCYTGEELDRPVRHSNGKGGTTRAEEFPRRDAAQSPRNRKFPDNRM